VAPHAELRPAGSECARGQQRSGVASNRHYAVDKVGDLVIGDTGPKKLANPAGRLLTFEDGSRVEVAVSRADVARLDAMTN